MKCKRIVALLLAASLVISQESVYHLTVQAQEVNAEAVEDVTTDEEQSAGEKATTDEEQSAGEEVTADAEQPAGGEATTDEEQSAGEEATADEEQSADGEVTPEGGQSAGEEAAADEKQDAGEEVIRDEGNPTGENVMPTGVQTAAGVQGETEEQEEAALEYQAEKEAFAALVADHDVYALLAHCTDADLLDMPGADGVPVVNLLTGHQVRLIGVEFAEGGIWYQAEAMVNGITYTGYLEEEVLVSSDEGLAEWKASLQPAGGAAAYAASAYSVPAMRAGSTDLSLFPESYRPYIQALITAHPNWTFVPMNTGLDWNTVIENEMVVEIDKYGKKHPRNMVPLNSMDTWKESNEVLSDPYWVQASESIVRYYMDPRNFLNETSVFQFELLSFNSANHTEAGVKTILKNTFMSDTIVDGTELTYAQAFLKIGKKLNISPYHLASRVRQEQGTKGDSPLISGTYPGYEGLYNYYNIQASGVTYEEIIANGLTEARNEGWTSRYLALEGGSAKVGNNYIKIGQNTLYLQKFDVDNSDGNLYWHQYMQNLLAADNEGKSVKKGYEEMGVLNSSFVFRIPVYNNMPSSACKMPTDTLAKPSLKASVKSYSKVTLSWSEIAGAQGYEIYRSGKKDSGYKLVDTITSVGTTSWSQDISANKTYYYKVRGYKTLGGVTAYSSYSDVKTASSVIAAPQWDSLKAASYSKAAVEWKKVSGVTGYQIYRKTGKSGEYKKIATVKGSATLSYSDSTILPNNTYYYKIRAYKTVNGTNVYSSFNGEKAVSTKMETPTLISVSLSGTNSLTLNWEKEKWISGYRIYRADSANGAYKMVKEVKGYKTTTYKDASLEANGTYYYKIRTFVTVNGSKKYSAYSNVIMGKTKLTTPKITSISASSATSAKLKWKTVTSATGYQVYRATSYNGKYTKVKTITSNTTLSYTNSNLEPGKTYYYKVRAYSKVGKNTKYSKFSSVVSISPQLETPEIKSVSAITTTKAKISWNGVEDAQGYRLYRSDKPGSGYKLVKTLSGAGSCSYTNTGLSKGKTYYYKVRAYVKIDGAYKYSDYSDIWSVQTKK